MGKWNKIKPTGNSNLRSATTVFSMFLDLESRVEHYQICEINVIVSILYKVA
jgi:hypothetical protein